MKKLSLKDTLPDEALMMDDLLMKELISQAAAFSTPHAIHILNIGSQADAYITTLLEYLKEAHVTSIQKDLLKVDFGSSQYDIIIATTLQHFLCHEEEWEILFKKFYKSLKPNGSLWISDFVDHSNRYIQTMMWKKYSNYLIQIKNQEFRNTVFASIEKEATPRSLNFQLDLLKKVGFTEIDVLHKQAVFASFGAIKR